MFEQSHCVLVADDDPQVRAFLETVLRENGHLVVGVPDGEAALKAAQVTVFDAAIVDYRMPPPDGLEVLTRLRKLQPGCVRLLITGNLDVDVAMGAINHGEAARILAKPFSAVELLTTMSEAVDMRRRVAEQYLESTTADHAEQRRYLSDCFARSLFRVAVQPIVSVETDEVVAYEALLRSNHPILTNATAVLAAAERQHRIPQLAEVVIDEAAHLLESLNDRARLFINLHPQELEDPKGLGRRLKRLSHAADRVVLEITERSRMLDVRKWRESTQMALDAGFALAVDDLGAGYSSLAVLAELKPQFFKIDMSIIRGCDTDEHKRRLVEMLCLFAAATGARVIAEGIETEGERATAARAGIHLLQGYLTGKPRVTSPRW
jgi:EAL domain-containing protein (putative c-di-GMP-specific phosphodiesterase class I)